MTIRPVPEFTRYASPAGSAITVPQLSPKLASPSGGPWIQAFVAEIEPFLANARHQSNYAPLGVQLALALPERAELLSDYHLDTFLAPLVSALSLPALRYAGATKAHGEISTLRIGPVGYSTVGPHGWATAHAQCTDLSPAAQRKVGHQVAVQVAPARWGALQLDLAIRTGILRDWVGTWRPLIESLVSIVGRRRDAGEFDLEDARIVSLGLHHDVDSLLGDTIDIDLRWRLLARTPQAPPLDHNIPEAQSMRGRA